MTGKAIEPERSIVETRGVRMVDGSGQAVPVRVFEQPDLEAIRVAITEADVTQGIGRPRGCWRTADNPLLVILAADVVTPLPVTRLLTWDDMQLPLPLRMAARSIVLANAAHVAIAYPDLCATTEAAKKALQREPIDMAAILAHRPDMIAVQYLSVGAGCKPAAAWLDRRWHPDPAASLTKILGALAWCRVGGELNTRSEQVMEQSTVERMVERGAVFMNAAHAYRAHAGMWPSLEAARKEFQRQVDVLRSGTKNRGPGHSPSIRLLLGECPQPPLKCPTPQNPCSPLEGWTYQPSGRGPKAAIVWINRAVIENPAAWLAERLGSLAMCEPMSPAASPAPVDDLAVAAAEPVTVDHSRSDPALFFRSKALIPPDAWVPDIIVRMKLRDVPKSATMCVWMARKRAVAVELSG